jgi:hypothetical protein
MSNDRTVKDGFLDTALKQIESGNPPEVRKTFERLKSEGIRRPSRCTSSPRCCAPR